MSKTLKIFAIVGFIITFVSLFFIPRTVNIPYGQTITIQYGTDWVDDPYNEHSDGGYYSERESIRNIYKIKIYGVTNIARIKYIAWDMEAEEYYFETIWIKDFENRLTSITYHEMGNNKLQFFLEVK